MVDHSIPPPPFPTEPPPEWVSPPAIVPRAEPSKYGPSAGMNAREMLLCKSDGIPCIVDPVMPTYGICALVGSSDSGKSAFLRYLAILIVTGALTFLGFPLRVRHRRVIYVSTEDDEFAISYLLKRQNEELQINPDEFAGLEYIFETENLLEKLKMKLQQSSVDLVIIDAFADIYQGSMNENNKVRAFLQEFNELATRYECLFLFLHHTGKRTEDLVPSKHNAIGSQGFEAKMRLLIELRSDAINPSQRHLCIVKGNYLPVEYKRDSFVLEFTPNMTFKNTGQRVPFEQLKKISEKAEKSNNNLSEKQEKEYKDIQLHQRILELRKEGKTLTQIAQEVGLHNHISVLRLLKKYESMSDSTDNEGSLFDE